MEVEYTLPTNPAGRILVTMVGRVLGMGVGVGVEVGLGVGVDVEVGVGDGLSVGVETGVGIGVGVGKVRHHRSAGSGNSQAGLLSKQAGRGWQVGFGVGVGLVLRGAGNADTDVQILDGRTLGSNGRDPESAGSDGSGSKSGKIVIGFERGGNWKC